MVFGDVTARIGPVQLHLETPPLEFVANEQCQARVGRRAETIADDDVGPLCATWCHRRRGHRMAVDQHRVPEGLVGRCDESREFGMEREVELVDTGKHALEA